MKCQICNINDAQIVFTQIVDNEKLVMQICSDCARDKGLSIEFETADVPDHTHDNPFDAMIENNQKITESNEEVPDITCPSCGLTYKDFKSSGLFGCDNCHVAYGKHIKDILIKIHGFAVHESTEHKKTSPRAETRDELKQLRSSLEHCVSIEEYEKAAELRDKITELQKGME